MVSLLDDLTIGENTSSGNAFTIGDEQSLPDALTLSASSSNIDVDDGDDKFLKIVKNITSKGFVRSNYEEKLVDLTDVRINLKTKN